MSLSFTPDTRMWPFFSRPIAKSPAARAGEDRHSAAAADAEALREDVAAVIYERFFPQLIWGNATRSGQSAAYASADAIIDILRARGVIQRG